eukprot:5670653-Pleurochrysis_carterae.AAC.1
MRRQNNPQYFIRRHFELHITRPGRDSYAGITEAPIKCMRHYGYLPARPVNWLIGQKACGCAAATLVCSKAGKAEAKGVANKPGRT